MGRRISQRLRVAPSPPVKAFMQARKRLRHGRPLVTRIVNQTRASLLDGDTYVPTNS